MASGHVLLRWLRQPGAGGRVDISHPLKGSEGEAGEGEGLQATGDRSIWP